MLDEPNANLEKSGESILKYTLVAAKPNDVDILLISHRPAVLSVADEIMISKLGSVVEYENSDDLLSKMMPNLVYVLSGCWLSNFFYLFNVGYAKYRFRKVNLLNLS